MYSSSEDMKIDFLRANIVDLGKPIDPMQKWLPLHYSFVHIQNSPTNLVFETKILKNLLSRTRLVGLF